MQQTLQPSERLVVDENLPGQFAAIDLAGIGQHFRPKALPNRLNNFWINK